MRRGDTYLNFENRFCCLGVACEIFKTDDTDVKVYETTHVQYEGDGVRAPQYVINRLNLYGTWGDRSDSADSLADINDFSNTFEPVIEAIKTGKYWKPLP